jgi:hypothetical protein
LKRLIAIIVAELPIQQVMPGNLGKETGKCIGELFCRWKGMFLQIEEILMTIGASFPSKNGFFEQILRISMKFATESRSIVTTDVEYISTQISNQMKHKKSKSS